METVFPDIITDPVHETTCLKCGHLMDVTHLPVFLQIACPECGLQQRVPGKMGSFLLVDLLGKGGMGAVFRGRDTILDRWVAVKVMQSSFGVNPDFVETFRREAQAAAALNHPNIVQIYSFGVVHGQPFMVMELLEGGR
ncbi:MAG: protein kinase, partial [bacterium]